jgi:hypothetical protein
MRWAPRGRSGARARAEARGQTIMSQVICQKVRSGNQRICGTTSGPRGSRSQSGSSLRLRERQPIA